MGKDAGELREEIDETRDRMGDTVDAIAYKTDVRSRIGDAIGDRVDAVKSTIAGTVGGIRDRAGSRAHDAREKMGEMVPDMNDMQNRASGAVSVVRENPLGLFFGMAAVGFLLGSLLPSTQIEDQRLGPIGDQLKEQAQAQVEHAVSTARDVATQAVTQAVQGVTGGLGESQPQGQTTGQSQA
jgi:ElaB/YqjD/DUF883 family membrane-anchored ribosome-binding protein